MKNLFKSLWQILFITFMLALLVAVNSVYASGGSEGGYSKSQWFEFAWKTLDFILLSGFLYWMLADKIKEFLSTFDWSSSALVCHNTLFDGCILSWKYGITPAFMYDTLCMARALHGVDVGGSLKALATRYEIGAKCEEVILAEG